MPSIERKIYTNGDSPNGEALFGLKNDASSQDSTWKKIYDSVESSEQKLQHSLPNLGREYGLLEIPGSYDAEFLSALVDYHASLSQEMGNPETGYLDQVEKSGYSLSIDQIIDAEAQLRLQVGPLGAFDAQTIAAWTHTQTAAYDAKDTLGDAPTTRKNLQYPADDVRKLTPEGVRIFERRLLSEMTLGWKSGDVVACLSVNTDEGLVIVAGGTIKVGSTSRPLREIIEHDSATVPTFQALKIHPERVAELSLEQPELLNTPEEAIACVSRLFSVSAIKGMESRIADLGLTEFSPKILPVVISALSTIHSSNSQLGFAAPRFVLFDTHMRALRAFSEQVFGATTVADSSQMSLFEEFIAKDTVHEFHYRHWLQEKRRISIGFTPFDVYIERSARILGDQEVMHPAQSERTPQNPTEHMIYART